jgi:predicted acylesterase/phospholipase RssA
MKLLSLSGGATKIPGLFGCTEAVLARGWQPDIWAGVSSGALTAAIFGIGVAEQARPLILDMSLDTIFDRKPVNEKGGFTLQALWRILTGAPSLGSMGNLDKLLRTIITKEKFSDYLTSATSKPVYVMAVNFVDGSRQLWNLKKCSHQEALSALLASCSIPVMCPPVWIDGIPYVDGGLRDHNPVNKVLEEAPSLSSVLAIYSRPEHYKILHPDYRARVLASLMRSIDILNVEVSKGDESLSLALADVMGLRLENIFLPAVMKSLYDVDRGRIQELYRRGYLEGVTSKLP